VQATLTITQPDGTTRTIELTSATVSTQVNLSQPLPHDPGVPVVPVTVLHLYAEVLSDSATGAQ
jgi:hypothetical protein